MCARSSARSQAPDKLQFAPGPAQDAKRQDHAPDPRKIAHNQVEELGDTSTLADPSVVDSLVKNRV